MSETPAINTNVRLFDLVRYMRSQLHEDNLISDEEYAWLCGGCEMANSPQGGSPSPRRLEDYDRLRERTDREIASLRNALRLAESALASLTWTPLTERQPTEDDGNEYHDVEWSDGKEVWQNQFTNPNIGNRKATHWRRITLPAND